MDQIIWSMQYTIISLLKKPEYCMLQKRLKKNVLVLCFLPKKSLLKWFRSSFYIIPYDQIWCLTSFRMFKAISMHTKPLKHTKSMQILPNYINKTRFCKISYRWPCSEALFKNSRSHNLHAQFSRFSRLLKKRKFDLND